MDLENICLENVQACILAGNICLAESNSDAESLFFGKYVMYLILSVEMCVKPRD